MMEHEAYYVLATEDRWSIHRDGEDLGLFETEDIAVRLATVLAKAACEMGFTASVVSIGDSGDIETAFECEAASLSEQMADTDID